MMKRRQQPRRKPRRSRRQKRRQPRRRRTEEKAAKKIKKTEEKAAKKKAEAAEAKLLQQSNVDETPAETDMTNRSQRDSKLAQWCKVAGKWTRNQMRGSLE